MSNWPKILKGLNDNVKSKWLFGWTNEDRKKNDHYSNFSRNSRFLLLSAILKQYNNLELLKIPTRLTKRKTQSPTFPPKDEN